MSMNRKMSIFSPKRRVKRPASYSLTAAGKAAQKAVRACSTTFGIPTRESFRNRARRCVAGTKKRYWSILFVLLGMLLSFVVYESREELFRPSEEAERYLEVADRVGSDEFLESLPRINLCSTKIFPNNQWHCRFHLFSIMCADFVIVTPDLCHYKMKLFAYLHSMLEIFQTKGCLFCDNAYDYDWWIKQYNSARIFWFRLQVKLHNTCDRCESLSF